MNISIGSSSSSFNSERSESSSYPAYQNHHHRRDCSIHQTTSTAETAHNETKPLDTVSTDSEERKDPKYDRGSNSNEGSVVHVIHSSSSEEADPAEKGGENMERLASATSISGHQRSGELFYTLPSRESISSRCTASNSLAFNPSFTASSAPPPPPLPPSPQSVGLATETPFRLTMPPRHANAPQPDPTTTLPYAELAEGGIGYLRRAERPADASSPLRASPQPSMSATSLSSAFARTESPSPLRKKSTEASASAAGAVATGAELAGRDGGNEGCQDVGTAHLRSDDATPNGASDCRFSPLHIPALKSVTGQASRRSGDDTMNGEVRDLSEAPASASGLRSAPPLPRPTATTRDGAAAPPPPSSSSSRLPSRSAHSAHSVSPARVGEPRLSFGRGDLASAAVSEERQPWRDGSERGASVSVTDYGARPPPHAPAMRLFREGESLASAASASVDAVGFEDVPWQRREEPPCRERRHRTPPSPPSSSAASSASSQPSPSVEAQRRSSSRKELFVPATMSSEHRRSSSSSSLNDAGAETRSTAAPAVAALEEMGEPAVAEAEVSSIAVTTPADTALSSNAGGLLNHTDIRNSTVSDTDHRRAVITVDESPPPLPPAPWQGVMTAQTRTNSAGKHAPKACSGGDACGEDQAAAAAAAVAHRSGVASKRSQDGQRLSEHKTSALDRWRAGVAETQGAATPSTTRGSSSSSAAAKADAVISNNGSTAPIRYAADADTYKGGVDFVRWMPASVGRDADFSGAASTPKKLPGDTQRGVTGTTATELRGEERKDGGPGLHVSMGSTSNDRASSTAARVVVAVPLVPSPHRKPSETPATAAVLAEVAHRRASASPVPGGVASAPKARTASRVAATSSPAAAAPLARQRLRLSAITSPQLSRQADELDRACASCRSGDENTAASFHSRHRHHYHHVDAVANAAGHGASHQALSIESDPSFSLSQHDDSDKQPVDAWTRQKSGRFLSSTRSISKTRRPLFSSSPAMDRKDAENSQSVAQNAVDPSFDGGAFSSHPHPSSYREIQKAGGPTTRHGGGHVRSDLDAALASRPAHTTSAGQDSGDSDESRIDDACDVPSVVRVWRPLSALGNTSLPPRRRTLTSASGAVNGRRGRAGDGGEDWNSLPSRWTSDTAAALSISVSDFARPLSSSRRAPPATFVGHVEASGMGKGPLYSDVVLVPSTQRTVGAPGYMAVYSPRTLATQVLQARDTLLLGTRPQSPQPTSSAPLTTYLPYEGINASREAEGHQTGFAAAPAVTRAAASAVDGSRAMPAIGTAVAVAAAPAPYAQRVSLQESSPFFPPPPPPPARVRVDLSRTPVQAPPVAEVLSNSYDDTSAIAPLDDGVISQYVEAPSQQNGGKAVTAAATATEPWSLFLERDSGYIETETSTTTTRGAWVGPSRSQQQQQLQGGVARRTLGVAAEAAQGGDTSKGKRSAQEKGSHHAREYGDPAPTTAFDSIVYRSDTDNDGRAPRESYGPSHASQHTSALEELRRMEAQRTHASQSNRSFSARSLGGGDDRFRAAAARDARQAQILEQQRMMNEEAFRRRQIAMQADHTISMEVTELNYRRALAYVQQAAAAAAANAAAGSAVAPSASSQVLLTAPPPLSSSSLQPRWSRGGAAGAEEEKGDVASGHLVGLSAVRRDQAAMAASLGALTKQLDSMSL